jgi:hypothetical protein
MQSEVVPLNSAHTHEIEATSELLIWSRESSPLVLVLVSYVGGGAIRGLNSFSCMQGCCARAASPRGRTWGRFTSMICSIIVIYNIGAPSRLRNFLHDFFTVKISQSVRCPSFNTTTDQHSHNGGPGL